MKTSPKIVKARKKFFTLLVDVIDQSPRLQQHERAVFMDFIKYSVDARVYSVSIVKMDDNGMAWISSRVDVMRGHRNAP